MGPRAPLVSGSLRAAGSRPRGARARSELTLRPPAVSVGRLTGPQPAFRLRRERGGLNVPGVGAV